MRELDSKKGLSATDPVEGGALVKTTNRSIRTIMQLVHRLSVIIEQS